MAWAGDMRPRHQRWKRTAAPRPEAAVTNTPAATMLGKAQATAAMASG